MQDFALDILNNYVELKKELIATYKLNSLGIYKKIFVENYSEKWLNQGFLERFAIWKKEGIKIITFKFRQKIVFRWDTKWTNKRKNIYLIIIPEAVDQNKETHVVQCRLMFYWISFSRCQHAQDILNKLILWCEAAVVDSNCVIIAAIINFILHFKVIIFDHTRQFTASALNYRFPI